MELLATIAALLNIVDLGFKIHERIKSDKKHVDSAEIFDRIAALLNEVANDLERGIYPHGRCSELEVYLRSIDSLFDSVKLREHERQRFRSYLNDAVRIEALLGQLNNSSDVVRSFNLNMLRSISGSFAALAQLSKKP